MGGLIGWLIEGINSITFFRRSGYYIYAEASFPRRKNDRARLVSPRLAGTYCLQFYYHMHGADMGTLQVFRLAGSAKHTLATYRGDHGKRWYPVKKNIRVTQNYQVNFRHNSPNYYLTDVRLYFDFDKIVLKQTTESCSRQMWIQSEIVTLGGGTFCTSPHAEDTNMITWKIVSLQQTIAFSGKSSCWIIVLVKYN